MSRDELIAALESATGPSREMDAWVAIVAKAPPEGSWLLFGLADPATFAIGTHQYWDCPRYTASIDAALTLVPEGWAVYEMGEVRPVTGSGWYALLMVRNGSSGLAHGAGISLALALTDAALKARSD